MEILRSGSTKHARRGTALYITVLSMALIVSLLGLAGLAIMRIELEQMETGNDRAAARQNARSAVDLALRVIANDPNWRTTATNGVETTPQSLHANASGSLSWILEDTDGSLTDADTDLRLRGVGRVGNTIQVSSVKIHSPPSVLDSLRCSVYAVGDINQSSNSTTNSGPFASAGTFTVTGTVYGDVEGNAVNVTGTGTVTGTITEPGPSRTMPLPSAWDVYTSLSTTIPYSSFTYVDANTRVMERSLLGVTINPYGFTDADGVYYIYVPAGQQLIVRMSRIHATLLIELESGATFRLENSCLWDPPNGANYPAMIVKSDGTANVILNSSNAVLKEGNPPPKVNCNPPGEPYDGVTDTDQNDQYPPLCRGVYHVIGGNVHTLLSTNLNVEGVVISEGTVSLGANLNVTVEPNIFLNPPDGYVGPSIDMEVVQGTWTWDTGP